MPLKVDHLVTTLAPGTLVSVLLARLPVCVAGKLTGIVVSTATWRRPWQRGRGDIQLSKTIAGGRPADAPGLISPGKARFNSEALQPELENPAI